MSLGFPLAQFCTVLGKNRSSRLAGGGGGTDLMYVMWNIFLPSQQLAFNLHCYPVLELPALTASMSSPSSFYPLSAFSSIPNELLIPCMPMCQRKTQVNYE